MTENQRTESDLASDIDFATEDSPILTKKEPNFHRFFARGSLLRVEEYDSETVQLAFWSSKEEGIPMEDSEKEANGYSLEAEAVMTWSTASNLRNLLDNYIEEHAPDEYKQSQD